jgi:hypothetical protein
MSVALSAIALCSCHDDRGVTASSALQQESSISESARPLGVSRLREADAILYGDDVPTCRMPGWSCSRPYHRCCPGLWCVFRECEADPPLK